MHAGQPEHHLDALGLERGDERLRAGHLQYPSPTTLSSGSPRGVAAQLLAGQRPRGALGARRVARAVRGEDQVGRVPQRMVGRQRLGIDDVEHGAQPAGAQLREQRAGVDRRAAAGADVEGAVAQAGERSRVDQPARGVRERQQVDDHVGAGQQRVELVQRRHALAGRAWRATPRTDRRTAPAAARSRARSSRGRARARARPARSRIVTCSQARRACWSAHVRSALGVGQDRPRRPTRPSPRRGRRARCTASRPAARASTIQSTPAERTWTTRRPGSASKAGGCRRPGRRTRRPRDRARRPGPRATGARRRRAAAAPIASSPLSAWTQAITRPAAPAARPRAGARAARRPRGRGR